MAITIATIGLTSSCVKTSGDAAQTAEAGIVEGPSGTAIAIDPANSRLEWEGAKPTGKHNGTIALSEGQLFVNDSEITGGNFVIDMNSITVLDLDGTMKANLENHLKGLAEGKENDFFNVNEFPTSRFAITKITALDNDSEANSLVYGNLTIRDITKEIGFKANIRIEDQQITISTAQFTIDRTQFGVNFGSKSVFDNLGDKFINDEFGLKISLTAAMPAL